jgi:hypothetical protein
LENLYKNIFPNVGGVNVKQDKKYWRIFKHSFNRQEIVISHIISKILEWIQPQ